MMLQFLHSVVILVRMTLLVKMELIQLLVNGQRDTPIYLPPTLEWGGGKPNV